jgi:hypothetical protein
MSMTQFNIAATLISAQADAAAPAAPAAASDTAATVSATEGGLQQQATPATSQPKERDDALARKHAQDAWPMAALRKRKKAAAEELARLPSTKVQMLTQLLVQKHKY